MMNPWKLWKNGFDRWESATAEHLDDAMQAPSLLGPSATVLGKLMRAKSQTHRWINKGVQALGLITRDEQERTLHKVNQLESRILDLQEELAALREER